ncbi:MAG: hypothetical protein ACRCTZ_03135 [Sarcina sp.]
MWIRSQDKKHLASVIDISIVKNLLKNDTYTIMGYYSGVYSSITLGEYPTNEVAMIELDNIEEHIINNPNIPYQMNEA